MATAASPVIPPGFEIETPAPRAVRAAAPAIPEGFEIESAVSPGVQQAADDANAESGTTALPAAARAKYKFIGGNVVMIPKKPGGDFGSEGWPAGEAGDPNYPRPKEIPLNSPGVEYDPKGSADDLAGEVLHTDQFANDVRDRLAKSLTRAQIQYLSRASLDYSAGKDTPQDVRLRNGTDSFIRGALLGQWPAKDVAGMKLTPEQQGHLDSLKKYMLTGQKPFVPQGPPTPAAQGLPNPVTQVFPTVDNFAKAMAARLVPPPQPPPTTRAQMQTYAPGVPGPPIDPGLRRKTARPLADTLGDFNRAAAGVPTSDILSGTLNYLDPTGVLPGAAQALGGAYKIARPKSPTEMVQGAREVIGGGFDAATPFMAGGMAKEPIKTAVSIAGGMATQKAVEAGLTRLGLPKEWAGLIGDLSGIVGGVGTHAAMSPRAVAAIKARVEPVLQARAARAAAPEATANTVGAEPYRPGAQPTQPPAQPIVAKAPEPPQRTQAAAPPAKPRYSQGPPEPPKPEPAQTVAAQPAIPPGYEVEMPAPVAAVRAPEAAKPEAAGGATTPFAPSIEAEKQEAKLAETPPAGFLERLSAAGKESEQWLRDNGITGGGSFSANRALDPQVLFHLTRAIAGDVARGAITIRAAAQGILDRLRDKFDDLPPIGVIEDRIREHLETPSGVQETGPHGPIYRNFRGDERGATDELLRKGTGDAVGVFHHELAPSIDLIYGEPGETKAKGYGLAKIDKWHKEMLYKIQPMLDHAIPDPEHPPNENTIQLVDGKLRAVIRKNWKGDPKTWLLTAFGPEREVAEKPSAERTIDVPGTHEAGRQTPPPGGPTPSVTPGSDSDEEPRRGAISPELLTLGVTKFIEHDVKPTLRNASNAIADMYDDVRIAVAPHLRGGAKVSALYFRKHLGEMARAIDQAKYALKLNEKFFNAEPDKEKNFDFMDRMESGRKQATPELDAIAKTLRATFDDWRQQVQDLGTGKLKYYYENYFPHIWERNQAAKEFFGEGPEISGRGPLQGSKAFLKRRQIRTIAEGRKPKSEGGPGLTPKSDNPVTLTLMKIQEMAKYVMAHRMLGDWADAGRAKLVTAGDDSPPGFIKIDPAIGSVYEEPPPAWAAGVREKASREPVANWYAEAGSAQLLNNYLGPRLTRFAAFRAAMGLNNTLNLANLGLSGFHLSKTAFEAIASKGAIGVEAALRGHPVEAAKHLGLAPFAPFTSFFKGDKMMKEWRRPGSQAETLGAIMDHLTSGGARAGQDQIYRTQIGENVRRALQQGNLPGAAIRAPFAAMEIPTRLLMDEVVPRIKLGTMADMAEADLKRLGPDASTEDVLRKMAETVDSVDNRMGEVARDNLFWNRYASDLGMFLMRADQYFLGTVRELGTGAAADIVRQPLNALRGEPVNLKRLSYVGSMLLMHTAAAAIYQKLHTGQWPQEAKDYFYPKNGQTDAAGRPERSGLLSYIKDVYSFVRHPVRTLQNKAAPALSLVKELYDNAGFDRVEIRHPDDTLPQQAGELGKYGAKQFTPFSVQRYLEERKKGASPELLAEQFFGINRAPADIDQTPAERLAREYSAARTPDEPRTTEAAERRELRQSLTRALRQSKAVPKDVLDAIKSRTLSKDDIALAHRNARQSSLVQAFTRLGIDEAMRVYRVADAKEKRQLRPILVKKGRTAMESGAPAMRAQTLERLQSAFAAR